MDRLRRSYETSILEIFVHVPDGFDWTLRNDRTMLCSVFHLDLEKLDGTARGSGL